MRKKNNNEIIIDNNKKFKNAIEIDEYILEPHKLSKNYFNLKMYMIKIILKLKKITWHIYIINIKIL